MKHEDALARNRAQVIFQVRSGQITATEGANRLGVSRKTFYEWEHRALEGMMKGLQNGLSGRPSSPVDPEVESLKKKVSDLENRLEIAKQTEVVRNILQAMDEKQRGTSKGSGSEQGHKKKQHK